MRLHRGNVGNAREPRWAGTGAQTTFADLTAVTKSAVCLTVHFNREESLRIWSLRKGREVCQHPPLSSLPLSRPPPRGRGRGGPRASGRGKAPHLGAQATPRRRRPRCRGEECGRDGPRDLGGTPALTPRVFRPELRGPTELRACSAPPGPTAPPPLSVRDRTSGPPRAPRSLRRGRRCAPARTRQPDRALSVRVPPARSRQFVVRSRSLAERWNVCRSRR